MNIVGIKLVGLRDYVQKTKSTLKNNNIRFKSSGILVDGDSFDFGKYPSNKYDVVHRGYGKNDNGWYEVSIKRSERIRINKLLEEQKNKKFGLAYFLTRFFK